MSDQPDAAQPLPCDVLSDDLASGLAAFDRHLRSERGLSPRSVRAYLADVTGLLEHVQRRGRSTISEIDLADLRSWLALQQTTGRARSTIAR
ncbi:MAG TPA: site-specific integrase, partial [Actinomycetes bacterium]|nr:site-specific integrase [Actinomycetes bacterium]